MNFYSLLGASADIKEAITKSTPETEEKAWKTIVPLVIKLKHFFEFSSKLEIIVPDIMNLLCNFPRKKSQGEERLYVTICAVAVLPYHNLTRLALKNMGIDIKAYDLAHFLGF